MAIYCLSRLILAKHKEAIAFIKTLSKENALSIPLTLPNPIMNSIE